MGKSLFDEVLGDEEIDVECPACDKQFSITLGQIGETVVCPHCNAEIELIDKEGGLADVEHALDELESTLDSF